MVIRTPRELGALIRNRRRQLALDQRTLAARVGVSRQWIIEAERGKPRAEVGLVLKTLAALGLRLTATEPEPVERTAIAPVDIDAIIRDARKPGR